MSVLIKGMEMPASCGDCPIGDALCFSLMPGVSWEEYTTAVGTNRRHSDCPLVPVPPHGRLIDADELGLTDFEIVMCDGNYKKGLEMLAKKIEDAPTVIPADKVGGT